MSKQNLRRRCTVLLSAFFSSAFITNANENINIENGEDVSENVNISNNEVDDNTNNSDLSPVVDNAENTSVEINEDINENANISETNNNTNTAKTNVNNLSNESNAAEIENVEKNIYVNINNTKVETNRSRQGLSTPVKVGLGVAATAGGGGLIAVGYKYKQYKEALDEAKKAVSASGSPNTNVGMTCIYNIEKSNAVWPLKIKLLKLMKIEKCWFFVLWLRSQIKKLPNSDQSKHFDFLETSVFIDACKNYQSGIKIEGLSDSSAIYTDGCLRFISGYLECNKDKLFSEPPTSFVQIPNWMLIVRLISQTLKPVGNPENSGDRLIFKFQTKANPIKIYELTLKK